ncbi:MAG: c-type cytochrome biogenesis protein CcmI [Pseudomonadota bacterium]
MFWIICGLLTLCVVGLILAPLLRLSNAGAVEDPQVALYKAQLAEVERDVAREVLAADDAERAKTEIARRLLAASKVAQTVNHGPDSKVLAAGLTVAVIAAAGGTYWALGAPGYPDLPLKTRIELGDEARANRPPQEVAEAAAPDLPQPRVEEDYLKSVEQLRALVPLRGDDLEGWTLLAYHEAQLRNYAAAAKAQARVIEILGEDATEMDLIRQVDLLVTAADGYISPEAEAVARRLLDMNANSVEARYYLGALFDQTDRPDRAFQLWRAIVESGAGESFHVSMARRQIEDAALRAGVPYTLPVLSGPSMEQMMAAEDMDPEARSEMISGMVASLSDRLATQGGSPAEWARLIVAHGVLGQTEQAKAVLAEARDVFGASDEAMALFDDAEARAGLSE